MSSSVDSLEVLIRELRRAPENQRATAQYERQFDSLFERVFEAGRLHDLGDLQAVDNLADPFRRLGRSLQRAQ